MLPLTNRRATRRPPTLFLLGSLALLMLLASSAAQAIPAYARQTGAACADCHAGSYGPALTPYGMRFKLGGYTDTDGQGTKIPLSMQLTEAHTAPARGDSTTRLTEGDLYLAGRLTDQVGGFVKIEADHSGHNTYNTKLSNLDLRFVAKALKIAGKEPVAALPDGAIGVYVNFPEPDRDLWDPAYLGANRDKLLRLPIPAPLFNVDLVTEEGEFLACPDAYWPDAGLVFEVDSREHHGDMEDWEHTQRRHAKLTAHGLAVLHASPIRIRTAWPPLGDEVVTALQDIGLKPAAEDDQGRLLTTRPRRRAPAPRGSADRPTAPTADEAAAAILAAERRLPTQQPAATDSLAGDGIDLLTEAARTDRTVLVTVVGPDGTPRSRTLRPVTVADGTVRAVDQESNEIVSVPISRIASARRDPGSG